MTKTVVVPLDGSAFSERAVAVGAALAERMGAELLLMTTRWGRDATAPRDYLDRVATTVTEVPVHTEVVYDREAVPGIEMLAADAPDATVCMSTHGRGGAGYAVLGSVAEAVVRDLGVPVVAVGPGVDDAWPQHWDRVVALLDGSARSEAIVAVAADWAKQLVSELVLVHVDDGTDPRPRDRLERLADDVRGDLLRVRTEVRAGDTVLELLGAAGDASLVAMTTHGRTGLGRVTLGSVAAAVVHRSPTPVLVSRPPLD